MRGRFPIGLKRTPLSFLGFSHHSLLLRRSISGNFLPGTSDWGRPIASPNTLGFQRPSLEGWPPKQMVGLHFFEMDFKMTISFVGKMLKPLWQPSFRIDLWNIGLALWLFKRSIQSHTNDLGHLFPRSLDVLGKGHPKPGCEGQAVGILT